MVVLYRLRAPQHCEGLSVNNDAYVNADPAFYGYAVDPVFADGADLNPPKVFDNGTVRNATQVEIDAIPVAVAEDENIAQRLSAKALLNSPSGKLLRAIVELTIDQLNVLRAQHSLSDLTLAQAKTAILNKIDQGHLD